MKRTLANPLIVCVPGLGFVIGGALDDEYTVVALGGILVVGSIYELIRKRVTVVGSSDRRRQRRSLILAGIIGASFAVSGVVGDRYLLAAAGIVILVGALLRVYGSRLAKI